MTGERFALVLSSWGLWMLALGMGASIEGLGWARTGWGPNRQVSTWHVGWLVGGGGGGGVEVNSPQSYQKLAP